MTLTLAVVPRGAMSRRTDDLHAMLERYLDARQTARDGEGGPSSRSPVLMFDQHTWTPAYRELERCLDELRAVSRMGRHASVEWLDGKGRRQLMWAQTAWWHLRERYLACRTDRRVLTVRKGKGGEPRFVIPSNMALVGQPRPHQGEPVYVRVWDPQVDPLKVEGAVAWIDERYRGVPRLPEEFAA